MQPNKCVACIKFPCEDVQHENCIVPDIDVEPAIISIFMISEASPQNASDYYYASGNPLFEQTTVQAFNDAGVSVSSIRELVDRGVYFTTAVKCAKTRYGIKTATINECSLLLEKELSLFPNVKVLMLMGDAAIRAVNYIVKRQGEPRVIPAGSTYKIRKQEYFFREMRVFPSYLQAGRDHVSGH